MSFADYRDVQAEKSNAIATNVIRVGVITLTILLIPLVLTVVNPNASIKGGPGGGFDWMPGDFVLMGVLIFVTGLLIDHARRKAGKYKVPTIIAIILGFICIWAERAVGAFTNLVS